MRKLIRLLMIGIIIFGIPSGVLSADENYKIGVLVPKTGYLTQYGQLQMEGYGLAETEMANLHWPVDVRYFDIGSQQKSLEEVFTGDVLPWKPDIIVGPYSSESSKKIASLLKGKPIPLILPSASLDELTMRGNLNVFRVALPAQFSAKSLGMYIKEQGEAGQIKTVGIFLEESVFGKAAAESLKVQFKKLTLSIPQVVSYEFNDFNEKLRQVEVSPNDLTIVISRNVRHCIQITKTLQEKTKVIGFLSGFLTPSFREFALEQKAQVFVYSPWLIDETDVITSQFVDRFINKYRTAFSSSFPQYHNAQAYTSLMIAGKTLDIHAKHHIPNMELLRETLYATPMGKISFVNYNGFFQQSMTENMIQNYHDGKVDIVFPPEKSVRKARKNQQLKRNSFLTELLDNQFIALFMIIGLGLLFGNIKVKGVSFGSSGVLFVALLFGHLNFTIPSGIGTLGIIFFIYCVGLSAGPTFFGAFAQHGIQFAKLSIAIVILASSTIVAMAKVFSLPVDLAVGIFAGALTSTPALAASMDNLKDLGTLISVGYGIAYPFGVIGVVLFVQLLPRILGKDLEEESEKYDTSQSVGSVATRFVEVQNESILGKKIDKVQFISSSNVRVARMLRENCLVPLKYDTVFEKGMVLKLVGYKKNIAVVIDFLGKKVQIDDSIANLAERDIMEVVVTSSKVYGKTAGELKLLKNFGVTITRITRNDVTFTPTMKTKIEIYDQLRVVGDPEALKQFMGFVGHRQKALQETDLLSLAVGMVAGVVLGLMPISIAQSPPFSLGLSGGLLIVSLILGHYGRIGPIVGRVPIASRILMMEIGLVFFLASAGVKAGGSFMNIIEMYGVKLFFIGALVTLLPMIFGYVIGTGILRINILQALGGICGGMTSTPALGAIKSKTDSQVPVVSYAAAYPVALIFMLIFSNVIIFLLK